MNTKTQRKVLEEGFYVMKWALEKLLWLWLLFLNSSGKDQLKRIFILRKKVENMKKVIFI
jgi:hypothetical protein